MDKHKQEAILEAYRLVREQTVRLANRKRTDPALVEDAVHEGIVNLLKSKARSGIRNLPAYLARAVYRELRRSAAVKRRDEARHVELDSIEQEGVSCSTTERLEATVLVGQLKEQLPLEELQLVKWHDADELSFEEIATLKNISPEAARKRYERSLRTIRRLLGV
jgi:RNA polymerase sigma factor (sigma-70 family)